MLLGLVAQLLGIGHVLFEHVGHGHDHHGHAHVHHDCDGHGHDHTPPPVDGDLAVTPDAHGCGDDCPVQDVPLTVSPAALAALGADTAPDWPAPVVPADHLAGHRAEPLVALAPKTSPPA